jgi:ADP-ribose pyrophosphatase YjhB (NUDIX family)
MKRGAFVAILHNDSVLLVKPPDWVSQFSGHWNFPGGVVWDNESLEEGAKREAMEETNIVCEVQDLLFSDYNEKYDTSIAIFRAKYISGQVKVQTQEISDISWFNLKESLEQPLAFNIKQVLLDIA